MLSYFQKMKNKKGFTMVEVIVVMAIIGVMAAFFIPLLTRDGANRQKAVSYAKSFYFAIQQTISKYKDKGSFGYELSPGTPIDSTYMNTGNYKYFIYAETKNSTVIHFDLTIATVNGYRSMGSAAFPAVSGTSYKNAADDDILKEIRDEIAGYFNMSADSGFFYAMIDGDFRVAMTYWSQSANRASLADMASQKYEVWTDGFVGENDYIFGAYPEEYCLIETLKAPANNKTWYDEVAGF